jgi:hypothetical protein
MVFSEGSVPRSYMRAQSEDREYTTVVEKDWVESLELAAAEMARKELGCEKKTSCAIWSDSETVINPLPEYD